MVVEVAEAAGVQVSLAAPTGRAAKRLSELTGIGATTVHRLLRPGPAPTESLFDRDPMDADLFVIDEASMLDLVLCERLLEKIPTGALRCPDGEDLGSARYTGGGYVHHPRCEL